MPRVHLIEIHDQVWCPDVLRDAATEYLQFVTQAARPYAPVADRLRAAIEVSGSDRIVDLCSGAGGPWPHLRSALAAGGARIPTVCLTDRFPNLEALRRASAESEGRLTFDTRPVDATRLPADLVGFRTLFASFHHFRPETARAILADAVERRQGIAVLEMTHRSLPALILMGLTPLLVLIGTPFVRPFRWSRLLWTYLVPVLPLLICFDGIVSCLRTYSTTELRGLVSGLDDDYGWDIGEEPSGRGPVPVTYLIGSPVAG